MSARGDSRRRGAALILAIVISAIAAVCVLALRRASAGVNRSVALERAIANAESIADSATVHALHKIDSGYWRSVSWPSDTLTLASGRSSRGEWRASIGRVGWQALMVRGTGAWRSGAPSVVAHADRRTLIPLIGPLPMPGAALTGAIPWTLGPGATVDLTPAVGLELLCRPAADPTPSAVDTFPGGLRLRTYQAIDPDTVSSPIAGVFRLPTRRLSRPLQVTGMLVSDSDLVLLADLRLSGVLVVRGSVLPAGGRLEVTGGVVTGDAGGGPSGLGSGDRVRYDACAIRRAVEQVTRPGPSATWVHFRVF